MSTIFNSRAIFTIQGAPLETFSIDLIKSVHVQSTDNNTPLLGLNRRPVVSAWIGGPTVSRLEIAYHVYPDSKTFNFKYLLSGLVNVQITLYKERELLTTLERCYFQDWAYIAPDQGEPAEIRVLFLGSENRVNNLI